MLGATPRLSRLRHLRTVATLLGAIAGVGAVVFGILHVSEPVGLPLIIAGVFILIIATIGTVMVQLALKIESNTYRLYSETREVHELLERYGKSISMIAENTSISEAAKSVANRSHERERLRAAVFEEIRREDYDAAFHLLDDLETRLGYREEAERMRIETREACGEAFRQKAREAIGHVHNLFGQQRWKQATREIERLEKLMPTESRIGELWKVLEGKRNDAKQGLLTEWHQAARDSNVERGLEILKELDQFLSREEARAMQESARELFKERLLQLGIQFQFAVKEHRWRDSLTAGLQIIEEFPNSQMAKEVEEHMAALRSRAGIPIDVEVTARTPDGHKPSDSTS
jgi:hypothetical protein